MSKRNGSRGMGKRRDALSELMRSPNQPINSTPSASKCDYEGTETLTGVTVFVITLTTLMGYKSLCFRSGAEFDRRFLKGSLVREIHLPRKLGVIDDLPQEHRGSFFFLEPVKRRGEESA